MRPAIWIAISLSLVWYCTTIRADDPKERAIAWVEAESAAAASGLDVDRRKQALTSGGAALGVHCNQVPNVTCRWRFHTEESVDRADLLVRFACLASSRFGIRIDGRHLGSLVLPATGGWGSKGQWQTGLIALGTQLASGQHTLEILAGGGSRPVNLDWLAVVHREPASVLPLSFEPAAASSSVAPVSLPKWSPPRQPGPSEAFLLDPTSSPREVWGHGRGLSAHYFDEFLPGLFQRTIALDEMKLDGGKLEWIFTGEDGGLTVAVCDTEVEVQERFYGSTGFRQVPGAPDKLHPEYTTRTYRFPYQGKLEAIALTMDHRQQLRIALNGQEVLSRFCAIDVLRHQLVLTGKQGLVRGECLTPTTVPCRVSVDPAVRHQTMLGFGGIATPTAYAQLSPAGKRRWWELICQYNLLIQREYPIGFRLNPQADNWERLADATPHYYSDNFPNGEVSNFDYIRTLRKLGGKVFFEFWKLPPWTTQDWRDPAGKLHHGVVDPRKYVQAVLAYCRASQQRAGAPPDVVGIQNEIHQPTPLWYEMTLALRKGLDAAGFRAVRIHMSDCTNLRAGIGWLKDLRKSPAAWSATDYVASHMYDYLGCFVEPDRFDKTLLEWREVAGDKPFLCTELCVPYREYQWKTYRVALAMGQLYHKNLVLADATAVCYCWTLLNVVQPSFGWTRALMVPDPTAGFLPKASSYQLRVFGAFSRRVREGMVRVDAQSADPDVLASAFLGGDGQKTVILLNRSTAPRLVSVAWPDAQFTDAELVDPYHPNESIAGGGQALQGPLLLPPGAILTLTNVPLGHLPADFVIVGADGQP